MVGYHISFFFLYITEQTETETEGQKINDPRVLNPKCNAILILTFPKIQWCLQKTELKDRELDVLDDRN